MLRVLILSITALFLTTPMGYAAAAIQQAYMTKTRPPDCTPPTESPVLLTTDAKAYLWFFATEVVQGDVFATSYYTPSGQYYEAPSGAFDPTSGSGSYCFTDAAFNIAGYPPASLPGVWKVKISLNGTLLTTVSFTVQDASSGGGGTTGPNLVVNPGAESGPAGGFGGQPAIPGWTTDGAVSVIAYSNSSGDLDATSPGPSDRGMNYFAGGNTGSSTMNQSIDVSASASSIDTGTQAYTLSGWIGGYDGQDDNATVTVTFLSASNGNLGTAKIGPVLSAERGGTSKLIEKTATGKFPSGTRKVRISVDFVRTSGSDNDGLADNLYFGLGGAPSQGAGSTVYLRFENGTANAPATGTGSVVDSSGAGQNGTPSGGLTYSTDVPVSTVPATVASNRLAMSFTSSGTVRFEGAFPLNTLSAATLEFWIKPGTSTGEMDFLWTRTDSTDANRFNAGVVTNSQGRLVFLDYREPGGAIHVLASVPIAYSGWTHVAVVKSGNVWTGYANGVSQGSVTDSNAKLPTNTGWTLNGRGMNNFAGLIDEFRISASALTPSQFLQPPGATPSCAYALSTTTQSVGAAQSTFSVNVTAGSGCSWSASTATPWLAMVSGSSGSGNGTVTIRADGNTSTASRTGTVNLVSQGATVQTLTVTQAGEAANTCSYMVQPQSTTVPATGYTGTILVSTQAGCTWTARGSASWITILSGSGTGATSGAVSYRVDANPATSVRTGTITIADRSVAITQEANTVCSYSLAPSSNSLPALGGASSFRITTGTTCYWSASVESAASTWLHITSSAYGTGAASVSYRADANSSPDSRSGRITVRDQVFTVTQPGGASTTGPVIGAGGVVNAASNRGTAIARGSFITIYGNNLGPASYQQASSYPIPDTMGGVIVTVSQGSYSKPAYLHFVSAPQINAILPSDTPLGEVRITVTYNGEVSSSASVNVVDTAFGSFTAAGGSGPAIIQNYNSPTDQPLNIARAPAKPGQIVILWGTGLGPITTGDNNPPPGGDLAVPVEVRVGGKLAAKSYSGRAPNFAAVDNIYFTVPAGVPMGCSVPVQVKAGGTWSNEVRMAISANGEPCQDPMNPFGRVTATGGKVGIAALMRLSFAGQIDAALPSSVSVDLGLGQFSQVAAGGDLAFSPLMSLPPLGTCASTNRALDFGSLLGGGTSGLDPSVSRSLDAGAALSVSAPGNASVTLGALNPESPGLYIGLLGGDLLSGGAATFLDQGPFTVSAPGGKDVGAFSVELPAPHPIVWTNQNQIHTLYRSNGASVTWSGGDANSSVVIAGFSTDQKTKATGGFVCFAPAAAGSFGIPSSVLADLPVTGTATGLSDSLAILAVLALPNSPQTFQAPGLDLGLALTSTVTAKAVEVK